jgi:GAF domain-containing protein
MTDQDKQLIDETTRNNLIEAVKQQLLEGEFDLYQFMDLVVNQIQLLTGAAGVVVEIVDNDEMVYRAATGTVKEHLGLRLKINNSFSGLCVQTCEILLCHDTENDTRVNKTACRLVGARSMVVVPLLNRLNPKYALGVLKILSPQANAFDENDINTLQLMARFLATALTNQMLKEVKDFF